MKTALLLSGGLGFTLLKYIHSFAPIEFVATDSHSTAIREYAAENGIPCFAGNPRGGKLAAFAADFENEVLLSINYLFIIEQDVIDMFRYPVNFHGSLLPRYRGRTPHVWAIINDEKETGVTAHIIDNGCDTGDIVLQKHVPIEANDTGSIILNKYNELYPSMVKEVIDMLGEGRIVPVPQEGRKATYYGKRTPEDGEISWEWQKERIRNWVRAQAHPYPGAFTFCKGEKVIIDEIVFSEDGYDNAQPNGTVLGTEEGVTVKTPNGAILLKSVRQGEEFCKTNDILGSHENR